MELTTTSYAILGHLAMQPWTMYDLAAQMRRNVHFFFPRAESQVYAEPKRLVACGLAEATRQATGKRSRTVYSITAEGHEVLRAWLASPVKRGPLLEFEALLRVMLAPLGDEDDLAATLQQVRDEIATLLTLGETICDEYTSGTAPFQRYLLARSMLHDFLWSFGELVDTWADRSLVRLEAWDRLTLEERTAEAVEVYRIRTRKRRRKAPALPPHDFHGRAVVAMSTEEERIDR